MHSQVSQACKLSTKMWHWIGQQVWPNISSHAQGVIPSLHSRPFLVPVQFPITVLRLSMPKDSEAVPRFPHLGMTTWVPSCLASPKWDSNYPSRTMCPGSKFSWLEPQFPTEKAKMPNYDIVVVQPPSDLGNSHFSKISTAFSCSLPPSSKKMKGKNPQKRKGKKKLA